MPQVRFRTVVPALNAAVFSYPNLTVGGINDGRWICNKAQDVIFNGHFCLQYGNDLAD